MNTSESVAKLLPALLAAQKEIKFAVKDAFNPHLKSKYADLPAVIDAIKEALNNAGIVYIQMPGETKEMYLSLTTRLMHESGEWLEDTMTMPIVKADPQGFGSALSYARRYSLAAITGLYQDDDDGEAARASKKAAKKTHSATDGALGNMSPDQNVKVQRCAIKIVKHFAAGEDWAAFEAYDLSGFDSDEKVALWSLLDSKTRSTLKKMKTESEKPATV